MFAAASLTPIWFCNLDGKRALDLLQEEPTKKEWVVQKLPIKGGHVLRSAMLTELHVKQLPWVQIEGTTIV